VDIKHAIIINYKMDVTALQAHVEKAFDDAEMGFQRSIRKLWIWKECQVLKLDISTTIY
jgi:hypothetical protein